jgi:hypothetical protein
MNRPEMLQEPDFAAKHQWEDSIEYIKNTSTRIEETNPSRWRLLCPTTLL